MPQPPTPGPTWSQDAAPKPKARPQHGLKPQPPSQPAQAPTPTWSESGYKWAAGLNPGQLTPCFSLYTEAGPRRVTVTQPPQGSAGPPGGGQEGARGEQGAHDCCSCFPGSEVCDCVCVEGQRRV